MASHPEYYCEVLELYQNLPEEDIIGRISKMRRKIIGIIIYHYKFGIDFMIIIIQYNDFIFYLFPIIHDIIIIIIR